MHEAPPAPAAGFRVPGGQRAFVSRGESQHAWQVCLGRGKCLQVPQLRQAQSTPVMGVIGEG